MESQKIKVGITHGDINGISYEIIIKTLMDNRMLDICTPVVYGSPKVGAYHRKALNVSNFSFHLINSASEANPKRANIIDCLDDSVRVELGKSTSIAGEASLAALKMAVNDARKGLIDVIVTAPINKHNIQSDRFNFKGHTEYLASMFDTEEVLMIMVSDIMKVGVLSDHIPLSEVPGFISKNRILDKLRIMNQSLIQDFAVRKPLIAVLGLNPHAGDSGLIGNEEIETIIPAINQAREEGIMALGPYPADGFFGSENFTKFDGILAMFHDQGLAPFKALVFESGVNYTAGLQVVRTSPAHGTAYEIAGKNEACPASFRQAVYLACDIFKNRKLYRELTDNSLTFTEEGGEE